MWSYILILNVITVLSKAPINWTSRDLTTMSCFFDFFQFKPKKSLKGRFIIRNIGKSLIRTRCKHRKYWNPNLPNFKMKCMPEANAFPVAFILQCFKWQQKLFKMDKLRDFACMKMHERRFISNQHGITSRIQSLTSHLLALDTQDKLAFLHGSFIKRWYESRHRVISYNPY